MEFEIEEDVLLDPSTNPSLVRRRRIDWRRALPRGGDQKAFVIPEEEDQLS